jgi:hypothetical protein
MATTTNYGWTTPNDTDLVKDGASAIRTLGSSIDTTVFANASAGIAKTLIDAKGDLIAGSAADTAARLAVGTNGQLLAADSTAATGLAWTTLNAGSMTVLASGTLSGSTTTLGSIAQTYKDLKLVLRNWKPDTDARGLNIRFNSDSGTRYSTVDSFGYGSGKTFNKDRMDFGSSGQDNTVALGLIEIEVPDYTNTTTWKWAKWTGIDTNATTTTSFNWFYNWGTYNQTGAITALNINIEGSGSFTSGDYILYGVK